LLFIAVAAFLIVILNICIYASAGHIVSKDKISHHKINRIAVQRHFIWVTLKVIAL